MRYLSTRGEASSLDFEGVLLAGLAPDGGLYLPETWPQLSPETLASLRGRPYADVAVEVMAPFVAPTIDRARLAELVQASYATFADPAVAPLRPLGADTWLLELFHGPTLAFKDVALQLLGRLFDEVLARRGARLTVVGATSGDTGSAAIEGCRGRDALDIFILHPHGRTSDVQRRQMTTVQDPNVFNIAIEGTFDDCQDMVKVLFRDAATRDALHLGAVNSINWARVLAQIVYYVTAWLSLPASDVAPTFVVPTGNFGDVFAGWCARQMGLPIASLVIATNTNDILSRTLSTGRYSMEGVSPTLSPSMDIQISSNFERALFEASRRDAARVRGWMEELGRTGSFTLDDGSWAALRDVFKAGRADDAQTLATIAQTWTSQGVLLDPHTAVGVYVAEHTQHAPGSQVVVLSTAHAAKFPDAVRQATGQHPPQPAHLADLFEREERYVVLPADVGVLREYLFKHARAITEAR